MWNIWFMVWCILLCVMFGCMSLLLILRWVLICLGSLLVLSCSFWVLWIWLCSLLVLCFLSIMSVMCIGLRLYMVLVRRCGLIFGVLFGLFGMLLCIRIVGLLVIWIYWVWFGMVWLFYLLIMVMCGFFWCSILWVGMFCCCWRSLMLILFDDGRCCSFSFCWWCGVEGVIYFLFWVVVFLNCSF